MNATYSSRELCIANSEGVIEDGFFDLLDAQDRLKQIGDGSIAYRDQYDEAGDWIEESDEDEDQAESEDESDDEDC